MKPTLSTTLATFVLLSLPVGVNLANAQTSWTSINTTMSRHLNRALYHDGEFLVFGNSGTILKLRANESVFLQNIGQHHIYDAVYSHGRVVAVGNTGGSTTDNGRVHISEDPATWTRNESSVFRGLSGVASNGERIVTVGHLSVWVSLNGVDFSRYILGSGGAGLIANDNLLRDVVYGGGRFVAVGGNGGVIYSADGIAWNVATLPSGYSRSLRGVSYGNGRFVAVGDEGTHQGGALTSSDGIVWQQFHTGAGQLNGVTFGNGKFVAVGNQGSILISDTGAQWSQAADVPTSQHLNDVTYGGRKFIAVGQDGTLLKSELAPVEFSIATAVELLVPTVAGVTYQILATRDLGTDPVIWEDFGEPFIGDGEVQSLLRSARGTDFRFFRVVSN